ncbi:MAG: glycosyltransferase, partial [Lachnospiraceae bacterium]|nr:glycosyltransferase [Lachnospiraceae bacterium]
DRIWGEEGAQILPEEGFTIFYGAQGKLAPKAPALFLRYFKNRRDVNLAYGDEAVEEGDGTYQELHFKPSWSPDSYLSYFYIGSVFAVRNALLLQIRADVLAGACKIETADDLFYFAALKTGGFNRRKGRVFPIGHIDEIVYQRPRDVDPYYGRGFDSPRRILPTDSVARFMECIKPETEPAAEGSKFTLRGRMREDHDKISIIIPSKDHPEVIRLCLETILQKTGKSGRKLDYEVVVVDNGSSGANRIRYQSLLAELFPENSAYIYRRMEFNFSRMCNMGAEAAKGNFLLFLNDDIEIAHENWLEELYFHAKRPFVGAAGMKLLYPERSEEALIQHVGITNLSQGPTHKLQRLSDKKEYYYGFNRGMQDRIGVTAACLMVERSKFKEAGGFFEGLAVAFNDVDLNFTLFEQGYYNVVCNNVFLYHHESLSRGNDLMDEGKTKRLLGEMALLQKRHKGWEYYDPFYNRHLRSSSLEEIEPGFEDLPEDTLKNAKPVDIKTLGTYREDECVMLTVDYAGDITKLFSEAREPDQSTGYCVKGYGIIVGSDNSNYSRYVLLRDLVNRDLMFAFDLYDWYRPDVEKNLHGQVNVAMTGFKCRIPTGALPKGEYEIGMLVAKHYSHERIVNWNKWFTLEVDH